MIFAAVLGLFSMTSVEAIAQSDMEEQAVGKVIPLSQVQVNQPFRAANYNQPRMNYVFMYSTGSVYVAYNLDLNAQEIFVDGSLPCLVRN